MPRFCQMASHKTNKLPFRLNTKAAQAKRLEKLKEFPLGCAISYTGNDDSVGNVVGYDKKFGRLLTDQKGSFDPTAMKVIAKKSD